MSPEERSQSIRKRKLCTKCFRGCCDHSCQFKCTSYQGHYNTLLYFTPAIVKVNSGENTATRPLNGPSNVLTNSEFLILNCSLTNLATQFIT